MCLSADRHRRTKKSVYNYLSVQLSYPLALFVQCWIYVDLFKLSRLTFTQRTFHFTLVLKRYTKLVKVARSNAGFFFLNVILLFTLYP